MPIISFNLSKDFSPLTKNILSKGKNGIVNHAKRNGTYGVTNLDFSLNKHAGNPDFLIDSYKFVKNGKTKVEQKFLDHGNGNTECCTQKPGTFFKSYVKKFIDKTGQQIVQRVVINSSGECNAQVLVKEKGKMVTRQFSTNPKTPDVIKLPKEVFENVFKYGYGGALNSKTQSAFEDLTIRSV